MGKSYIVDVVELGQPFCDVGENSILLDKQEFADFMEDAKTQGTLDKILRSIDFSCAKCKSFVVSARVLYEVISSGSDFEGFERIAKNLVEPVTLSDEEWFTYLVYGPGRVKSLQGAEPVQDCNGDLCRFIKEDVFFRYDTTCDCVKVLMGNESEPLSRNQRI